MNGSPSVRVALFIRESGSESPCRWFYVTGIYTFYVDAKTIIIMKRKQTVYMGLVRSKEFLFSIM